MYISNNAGLEALYRHEIDVKNKEIKKLQDELKLYSAKYGLLEKNVHKNVSKKNSSTQEEIEEELKKICM